MMDRKLGDQKGQRREIGKEAGLMEKEKEKVFIMIPEIEKQGIPKFSKEEEEAMKKEGAVKNADGEWVLPNGRKMLNKLIMRNLIERLHEGTHWGAQALIDLIQRKYVCKGIYSLALQMVRKCMVCLKTNKAALRKQPMGGRELAIRPFQRIQIDYTELPKAGRMKN